MIIRFTDHAREQCDERGATEDEVIEAIQKGNHEKAKKGRLFCRANFQYNALWNNRYYTLKQVAAVIVEEDSDIVVVTVYTFYY